MNFNEYKKWLAIGTGVGIEIGARDLTVTLVRVRPSGARVAATFRIENYAERPAAEWGADYAAFLKQNGASYLAASVLLPRRDVIVRQIALPGVSDRDLANAVRFQIDGLHPYSEDDAVYDWARIGSATVLIGIARRDLVDRYVGLFAEAGIKIAAFTFSAAVIYSALRLLGAQPAAGFLAIDEHGKELEAYGESEARPVFSATFDIPNEQAADRARALALGELRLPPETESLTVSAVLPVPASQPEAFDLESTAMPYATALAAACPRLSLGLNLLPAELRNASSRAMYIPTIALGCLLLLSFGALLGYGAYEDHRYRAALGAEIHRLEPVARKPLSIDRAIAVARQRAALLDNFRRRTQADLDALNELTHIVAAPGFANTLEITRDQIRMSGETDQAAGLLKALDKSPLFEGSDFSLPMTRTATGESFSIRSRREAVIP
jgi:hypothetical protein